MPPIHHVISHFRSQCRGVEGAGNTDLSSCCRLPSSGKIIITITRLRVNKDKPKGWFKGNWMVGGWVAYKILVTIPEAKSFPFGGFGLWTGIWPQACQ